VCNTARMKAWSTWLSILVAAVAFGSIAFIVADRRWPAHQILGLIIAIPAFCLWILARMQLRKSFAVTAQAKELVTHGLYSRLQNPVYVFGALMIAGLIVFAGQPRFFLLFVILIPLQWVRIRNERRALQEKFGEVYRDYRRRTWF
jgi:protein-S-isoprenylcysteine O-methyltransferase Ste14